MEYVVCRALTENLITVGITEWYYAWNASGKCFSDSLCPYEQRDDTCKAAAVMIQTAIIMPWSSDIAKRTRAARRPIFNNKLFLIIAIRRLAFGISQTTVYFRRKALSLRDNAMRRKS